jgi:hypothetical protein
MIESIFTLIVDFLSYNDIYAIKEINRYMYLICTSMKQYPSQILLIKQPGIDYICSSKNLFEWAKEHPYFYNNNLHLVLAKHGKLNVLQYILENGYKYDPEIYYEAAKNNHYEIIKWCYKNNLYANERAIQGACERGDLYLLKWMDKRHFPFDENACNMAVYNNNMRILKFLVKKNYPWNKKIYNLAAERGNIRMLQFLSNIASRDLSFPWWDEKTTLIAAKNNNFETLKWLRNKRCPWNVEVIYAALECGNIDMVNWCIDNGCKTDQFIDEIIVK